MIALLFATPKEASIVSPPLPEPTSCDSPRHMRLQRSELAGEEVLVLTCGVGKVAAAAGTMLLLERHRPRVLLVCGTAGALSPRTRAGELVNIDCTGNRLAGMIFGPRRVIVVAGVNKVVDDLAEAMRRLKKIAPLNTRRIGHATPCVETGRCMDCTVQKRLCNYVGIIYHGRKFPGRISVVMVAEEAGF